MHASGEPAAAAAPHSASSTSLPPSNGTHANQDQDEHVHVEGDERELPVVLQDLVPLSYLIDRVVSSAYSDLATLVETLPGSQHASTSAAGTDDQARKRKIVDHVLNSRRQLVKLLVLARWSKEAHRLHKAINIVGFLAIQNHQIDRAIEALTETHGMLARARVRNYDLASALSVLSTGSAASLPASLTDPFAADLAHPLTDTQVLDTLAELDRVLLARLVLRIEPLPPALSDPAAWRIHDGRVTFRVDGMWEADLTFGGDNESEESTGQQGGEWYLLAIRFLFRVKDARGAWSSTPLGPIKDHLLQLCNQELLRRPYFPPPLPPRPTFALDPLSTSATTGGAGRETSTTAAAAAAPLLPDPQAPPPPPGEMPVLFPNGDSSAAPNGVIMGGEETKSEQERVRQEWDEKEREWQREKDEVIKKRKRDRPLDRGYTFLQRLALSYQLEAVHSSAARLAATSWNGSLEVERRTSKTTTAGAGTAEVEGEDEVRIHYWRPPAAISSSAAAATSGKPLRPASTPAPSATSAGPAAQPGRRAGPGGTLVFSLQPIAQAAAFGDGPRRGGISRMRGERARRDALQAALDRAARSASASSFGSGGGVDDDLEDTISASQSSPTRIDVPKTLSVTWLPSTTNGAAASIPSALASLNLTSLLGSDLDVERVLRHVTASHARDAIERLSNVILAAPTSGSGDEAKKHGRQQRARLVYSSSRRRRRLLPEALAGSELRNKGEVEEEDSADVVVPYLHLPLVGAHAIGAHIDPVTGRFELRVAPAIAPDAENLDGRVDLAEDEDGGSPAEVDGGSSARDQRLRLASERIDRERFGPAVASGPKGVKPPPQQQQQTDPDAWMKGVVEVVARIRASTIIDELDTLLSLLSLPLSSPPVRRLPLPPRELAKLGPNASAAAGRAAFLFVPLLADEPALAGWFLVLELFEDGIRAALLSTAERSDQLGNWTEILEVGWLGTPSPATTPSEASEGKTAETSAGNAKGANLGFEIKSEVLRSLWWHCVRRAAAFSLELQLHLRRIPYRRESVSSVATASRLVLPTATLLRVPDVEQLLRPDAELRCAVEEDGGRKTILLVYLRITPGAPSPLPPPSELPPSVLYNPARGALVLVAEGSFADTVERLLRALATVLKLVRSARPLGSPAKASSALAKLKTVK